MMKELFRRLKAAYYCLAGNSVLFKAGIEVIDGKARIYPYDLENGFMYLCNFHAVNNTERENCSGAGLHKGQYVVYGEKP